MIVANFLSMDKEHYNVQITFWEYLTYLINRDKFLLDLSEKFGEDFFGSYYFGGVIWKGM